MLTNKERKECQERSDALNAPEKAQLLSLAYTMDSHCWGAQLADDQQGCGDHGSDAQCYYQVFLGIRDILAQVHNTMIDLTPYKGDIRVGQKMEVEIMEWDYMKQYISKEQWDRQVKSIKGFKYPVYTPNLNIRPCTEDDNLYSSEKKWEI